MGYSTKAMAGRIASCNKKSADIHSENGIIHPAINITIFIEYTTRFYPKCGV